MFTALTLIGLSIWGKIDEEIKKKQEKEKKEKEQNKDWMYYQREQNELGADYFSYQGYHPPTI